VWGAFGVRLCEFRMRFRQTLLTNQGVSSAETAADDPGGSAVPIFTPGLFVVYGVGDDEQRGRP